MQRFILPATLMILLPAAAGAVECVNGVYRAGCVGPNGAAAVRKAPAQAGAVKCADGVWRAACTGPNGGTAVIRR